MIHGGGDRLVVEVATQQLPEALAAGLALRANLFDSLRIASSLAPLQGGDEVLVGKGPLIGTPTPGDLMVYTDHGHRSVHRVRADATPTGEITGRVLAIGFAFHDGGLDWDRIAAPLD